MLLIILGKILQQDFNVIVHMNIWIIMSSPYFFESDKLFALNHAGTSDQSLGKYFEGVTPWVLFDLTNILSSTEVGFSLCFAQELFQLFSIPCAAEYHPLSGCISTEL